MNRSAKLWFVSHSAETSSVAIAHAPATPTTWPWRNDGVATLRKAFLLPAPAVEGSKQRSKTKRHPSNADQPKNII
jgi:hypothetical protein